MRSSLLLVVLAAPALFAAPVPSDGAWWKGVAPEGATLLVYPPQADGWGGDQLRARAAVAVKPSGSEPVAWGVVWLRAQTRVEERTGRVALLGIEVVKGSFPSARDGGKALTALVQQNFPATGTLSLAGLEASPAIESLRRPAPRVRPQVVPPRIVFVTGPVLVVRIDGDPVIKPIEGTNFLRVVNTRTLLFQDKYSSRFYLPVADGWLMGPGLNAAWTVPAKRPPGLEDLRKLPTAARGAGEPAEAGDAATFRVGAGKTAPVVVLTGSAELVRTAGKPDLEAIPGTRLEYVRNTKSDVLFDGASRSWFVLASGRWFRARDTRGPWEFVDEPELPKDFARIPKAHSKASVLAHVPGAPEPAPVRRPGRPGDVFAGPDGNVYRVRGGRRVGKDERHRLVSGPDDLLLRQGARPPSRARGGGETLDFQKPLMSTADRFNAERIRRTVGLEEFAQVLEALGASVDRSTRRSSCPVHKGTGREAVHFEERDGLVLYKCLTGCGGAGGDVLAIVQRSLGVTLPLAAAWLRDTCGLPRERRRKDRRAAAAAAAAPVAAFAPAAAEAASSVVPAAEPVPNGAGAGAAVPARNGAIEWDIALSDWRSGFERKPVATGLKGVDELLGGGLRDRRLYVMAGLAGGGKSALALRIAHFAAASGVPVIYVSYEMEEIEARARLVAAAMKTPFGQLLAPDALLQVEREQVGVAWRKYAESGPGMRILLTVSGADDGTGNEPRMATMEWLKGETARVKRDFGQPPLVVVDDLQAAAAFSEEFEGDPSSFFFAVGLTALSLRVIARTAGSPVLALSSVRRSAVPRPGGEYRFPELGDLEESGRIESNADAVLALWPERADWEAHEGRGEPRDTTARRAMFLRALKGRQSGTGAVGLLWYPVLGTFEETRG